MIIEYPYEQYRPWRLQRYRVKVAVAFMCQYEGCGIDHATKVVNLDGSPWLPEQERDDSELTVRCRKHRDTDPTFGTDGLPITEAHRG